ncbi:hypothetical protein D3875_02930 [Deinococcus cavernae]|uniref:Uncharacterized protein n=1 Tax=Deinococcus cavernae TaxID=2320857 RepID=A0A418VFV1_9DEIO|nr:hypothetical protein [Deinococcus cavernae]RJF74967.1 hypothetical protein D3875_02930 [Deinococcus cavernae]
MTRAERQELYEDAAQLIRDAEYLELSTVVFVLDPARPDSVKVFETRALSADSREALRDWLHLTP